METHTLTTAELPSFTHSFTELPASSIPFVLKRRADAPSWSPTPLNDLARECHSDAQGFWHDLETGLPIERNKGEMCMLIVSEISEAFEGERKNLMDDHLPHRKCVEVEFADAFIRMLDYAGRYGFDLDGAVAEKRAYNRNRKDHTREARLAANGKKW